ncbi:MAG: DUF6155 family protein [Candidatus Cloacimonadales bacterium]
MGLREVKIKLKELEKDEIIKIVGELYQKNKPVKEYLDFLVEPNEKALHKKYREKVFEAFYPKRGMRIKLKEGQKAITDFKKLNPSPELLADLMFFYVEMGIKTTNEFGDMGENFYLGMESFYETALIFLNKNDLLEKFLERSRKLTNKVHDDSYGFKDALLETYYQYHVDFSDDEEDE